MNVLLNYCNINLKSEGVLQVNISRLNGSDEKMTNNANKSLDIMHINGFHSPSVALSVILRCLSQTDGHSTMMPSSSCLPSTGVKTRPVHGPLGLSSTQR